jgi:3-hydroxyisobutyrate dehydrogenase-like beta-hydroxyacid dehydrogenase
MRLGFIGLGIMGESMAENLLKKSGQALMVYDISGEKIQKLVRSGAAGAACASKI